MDSFAPYAFGYRTYPLALFIVMSLSYIRLLTTFFGDHHHLLQEEIKHRYRLSVKADSFVVAHLQAFFFKEKAANTNVFIFACGIFLDGGKAGNRFAFAGLLSSAGGVRP